MLIQQRQPFKEGWSGMWDITVGGSAVCRRHRPYGRAPRAARRTRARRRLFGQKLPALSLTFNHGFDDYYLIEQEVDFAALKLPARRGRGSALGLTGGDFANDRQRRLYPYYPDLIRLLFQMRQGAGRTVSAGHVLPGTKEIVI